MTLILNGEAKRGDIGSLKGNGTLEHVNPTLLLFIEMKMETMVIGSAKARPSFDGNYLLYLL